MRAGGSGRDDCTAKVRTSSPRHGDRPGLLGAGLQRGYEEVTGRIPKIITRAGHKPWPRLFQNLRASCATDWVERYPNHVVAKWLGHSPMIAATHYLQTRERHFEDVVTGGGNGAIEGPEKSVHICVQSKAATNSSASHESRQLSEKPLIVRTDADRCEPQQTDLVGNTGFEPVTSTV